MRIELPEGNWAEIRDVDDLYDEDRKKVLGALTFTLDLESRTRLYRGDTDEAMVDAMLRLVVENWSYTHLAIPGKNPNSLGKLKIAHARALREGVAKHMKVVLGTDEPDPTGSENSDSSSQDEFATVA